MKITIKQLFRTPLKTALFTVLIALAVMLLSVGVQLCLQSLNVFDEIYTNFRTVGTIAQNPDSFETVEKTFLGETLYEDVPVYTGLINLDDVSLNSFIKGPEHRGLIYSHVYRADNENKIKNSIPARGKKYSRTVAVFTPTRDYILFPDEESNITNNENNRFELNEILYGDKYADFTRRNLKLMSASPESNCAPIELKEGVSYIGYFTATDVGLEALSFYYTDGSDEYNTELNEISPICEYTENIWDTENGEMFSQLIDDFTFLTDSTIPVTATESIDLFTQFSDSESVIVKGRNITEEEFETGAKVCIISETTNTTGDGENYITVGDKINIYPYARYYNNKPQLLSMKAEGITANDRYFSSGFSETEYIEYEIVGVYFSKHQDNPKDDSYGYYIPDENIIVPKKSINVQNIPVLSGDRLSHETSSFMIENGTIDSFMDSFEHLNLPNTVVEFNDMGYSSVAKGTEAVLKISIVLLVAGGISALAIIILFTFLQIVKKKSEAAIMISLGTGIKKTAVNLVASVMIVVLAGTLLGISLGSVSVDKISTAAYESAEKSGYDRSYSDVSVTDGGFEYVSDYSFDPFPFGVSALAVVLSSLIISTAVSFKTVNTEPIKLLSKAGE